MNTIYAQTGYSFPMGPVIPSPDATRQPLFPELVKSGLNRSKAASKVMVALYRDRSNQAIGWKRSKEPMTSHIDLACRNLWQRVHTQDDPEVLNTAQVSLRVLEGWAKVVQGNKQFSDFTELVEEKLHQDLLHFHHKGRNDARDQSLLFAPPFYPTVGEPLNRQPSVQPWAIRYGHETRAHMRDLLQQPAGEWGVFALFFIKLLHAHMGWLAPSIRQQRQVRYYRPVLQHLKRCAQQAGTPGAHPLAETAAGVWDGLRRMNALFYWREDPDPLFPKHPDPLDPRDALLPDCLHMDSGMWVDECLGEMAQILSWMDAEAEGGEDSAWGADPWLSLLPLAEEVATLAWEMASYRTDPFAMGGLGISEDTPFNTGHKFKRYMEDYQAVIKGVRARVRQLQGGALTKKQSTSLGLLPDRFLLADGVARLEAPSEALVETDEGQIDQLEIWVERPAQLRLFFESLSKMLVSYGLDQFQSRKGNQS
ncbi:MAG: hypothetical protein L6Q69_20665 [Zoogloea sp.]|nr:hypothetical protein [Zoogloea sp.]